jgi:hypothetical protein
LIPYSIRNDIFWARVSKKSQQLVGCPLNDHRATLRDGENGAATALAASRSCRVEQFGTTDANRAWLRNRALVMANTSRNENPSLALPVVTKLGLLPGHANAGGTESPADWTISPTGLSSQKGKGRPSTRAAF